MLRPRAQARIKHSQGARRSSSASVKNGCRTKFEVVSFLINWAFQQYTGLSLRCRTDVWLLVLRRQKVTESHKTWYNITVYRLIGRCCTVLHMTIIFNMSITWLEMLCRSQCSDKAMCWTTEEIWFDSWQGMRLFSIVVQRQQTRSESTWPYIQAVPAAKWPGPKADP